MGEPFRPIGTSTKPLWLHVRRYSAHFILRGFRRITSPQNLYAVQTALHMCAMKRGESIDIGNSEIDALIDEVTEEGCVIRGDGWMREGLAYSFVVDTISRKLSRA